MHRLWHPVTHTQTQTRVHTCSCTSMSAHTPPALPWPRSHCIVWRSDGAEGAARVQGFGRACESSSFVPITFLSSDLHYVITSWTVIFKFSHSESFNPGTRTDPRQSITGLLLPGRIHHTAAALLYDLAPFLTLYRQCYRGELWKSLW